MTDADQFATYCVPTIDEAKAAGLDPDAWEPVLDLRFRHHRLQLALAADLPIMVPEWADLGFFPFQGGWRHALSQPGGRPDAYDAEVDRRRTGEWELWVDTDDPQWENVVTQSEPEMRWTVAVLRALHAGCVG